MVNYALYNVKHAPTRPFQAVTTETWEPTEWEEIRVGDGQWDSGYRVAPGVFYIPLTGEAKFESNLLKPAILRPLEINKNTERVIEQFVEHGNLTTGALVEFTGLSRPTVTKRLDRLFAADYIEYLHRPTALWRLTADPRTE